jgi:hypothetical protein
MLVRLSGHPVVLRRGWISIAGLVGQAGAVLAEKQEE